MIAFGAVGFSVPLRELHFDLSNAGQTTDTVEDTFRVTAIQAVNALIPDPGSPFAEYVPYWRKVVLRHLVVPVSEYERQLPVADGSSASIASGLKALSADLAYRPPEFWLIMIGSITSIFAAATLLRFRTVMALKPPKSRRPRRFGWLAPSIDSLQFGFSHFGSITVHVWLLRLAIFMISATVLILTALSHSFVVPGLTRILGGARGGFESVLLTSVSLALVNAIFTAFSVVYDARLFNYLAHT